MDESQRAMVIRRVKRRLKVLGVLFGAIAVALLAVYFAAPRWLMRAQVDWQARRAQLTEKSVQAGDARWSYYEGGKGPTLLLLHGDTESKDAWLPAARYLTPNFHVVIPDLPGWGGSSRDPKADYGYAAQADRLRAFVEKLGLGGVAIAGHSMGGAIAGVYASRHPRDVAALVLVDSAGAPYKENAFLRDVKAGRNPLIVGNRADFDRARKLGFENPPWLPPRFKDALVDQALENRDFDNRVFRELMAPEQRGVLTTALPQVTSPTLAIWCRQDRIIDLSALDAIRAGLTSAPKISVAEFNGCGHMSILERPREIADTITRFVLMP